MKLINCSKLQLPCTRTNIYNEKFFIVRLCLLVWESEFYYLLNKSQSPFFFSFYCTNIQKHYLTFTQVFPISLTVCLGYSIWLIWVLEKIVGEVSSEVSKPFLRLERSSLPIIWKVCEQNVQCMFLIFSIILWTKRTLYVFSYYVPLHWLFLLNKCFHVAKFMGREWFENKCH